MDQRPFLPCKCVCDPITFQKQLRGASGSSFRIGMYGAKWVSGCDSISNLAMQGYADGRIDRIFFFFPAAT